MRTEETIQNRLESVEEDIEDLEESDGGDKICSRLEAYAQALRYCLREREEDDQIPIGSRWRQQEARTGQVIAETRITNGSPFDEVQLACKSKQLGQKVKVGSTEKRGVYVLLRELIDRPQEQAEEYEPPVEI